MQLDAGERLGPYEILARIGAGGMGEVWKARDTRLNRVVAIKRLKGQHASSSKTRFEQEARAIAALNHPNICVLHDIGPDYLVMEYIEGKPLPGKLPPEEAVRFAIQIASALEEAHGRGILHRDLKPGNILLTAKGSIKLLDFGLAKLMAGEEADADATRTTDGTVLGTAAYMSPEQAQAKALDERSDVFSFGAVLYEMLSGARAFRGDSLLETLNAVVRDEPAPLQSPVSDIVKRCMAKHPGQRFQSIAEVRAALEALRTTPSEQQPSIAVLPFANMSGDKEQEYFSDGLAEEIINALTHVPGLKVIARTSAFAFKGQNQDIRRIAEALGVVNVLEGSVRKAGNRVRVTAQLITAADGSHLWSERYDRELTDVFAIQDEIAAAIVEALRLKLAATPEKVRRYKPSIPAYEAYLKARYYRGKLTPETMALYGQYLDQAIALDPRFPLAHVELADASLMRAHFGSFGRDEMPRAREHARKALEIDPALPEAQAVLGIVAGSHDHDWKEAERRFRLAMAEKPVSPLVLQWYGFFYLFSLGRPREAAEQMEKGLADDPLNILSRLCLADCYYACGMLTEAAIEVRKCLELEDKLPFAHFMMALIQACQGQLAEAIASAEKAHSLANWTFSTGFLAGLLLQNGERSRAEQLLAEFEPAGASLGFASFHLQCGEVDEAADWIEKAIEERHPFIIRFLNGPVAQALRSSDRWLKLVKMRNLPEAG
jgi:eukaryotic-like serine/threonine-protein kinase